MSVPFRIEVYEKYPIDGAGTHSDEWWEENMPAGAKRPEQQYGYRRTFPLVEMIERPIEIPGNKKEFLLRFWTDETLTCLGSYDEFCITLQDLELELIVDEDFEPETAPTNAS